MYRPGRIERAALAGGVLAIAAAGLAAQSVAPSAQELSVPAILPPTAEGDWVRTDTHGSGSWDQLLNGYTPASIKPEYTAKAAAGGRGGRGGGQQPVETTPHAVGVPYVVRAQTCGFNGALQLGLEYDSEGFHMVYGKDEALVVQERGGSRRIYLDGRELPGPSVRTPTVSGYSIGHVEADGTLVVETTDATEGPVTLGGYRLADSHFIQRYIPSADGKRLTIRYEYNDPRIYLKPHVFEFTFDRMMAGSYALETFCDATNPLEGQSIVPPAQDAGGK